MSDPLNDLVAMSNYLGDPTKPYAILGEGNTSARIDEDSFYVKASGTCLGNITADGFLPVSISKVTAILDDPNAGDEDVDQALRGAVLSAGESRKPSVETMMHALLYEYPEFNFIGHTHPVATGAILCSVNPREAADVRVCPDQIVVMGHKSVFVPYLDPGLVLAREVRDRVRAFVEEESALPRSIMLQSHGLFALGSNANKVTAITDMAEKCAQIIIGAHSMGGVQFLSPETVRRIDTRPDELYRQKVIQQ